MTIEQVFDKLWTQYSSVNEQAEQIHSLLESKGEKVLNDHIAIRTFNHPKVGVDVLGQLFIDLGYEDKGEYHFEAKKLYAKHYEHPTKDIPLVFISELLLEKFSPELQETVNELVEQVPVEATKKVDFLWSGIQWPMISYEIYQRLLEESEYAAWTATFGFRANHFTIFVNELKNFDLLQLNEFIKEKGWALNSSGGEVKGSPEVYLEQSSTLAAKINLQFSDFEAVVPCCYYEFAQRYSLPSGELYTGFVSASADKIFESTNVK